MKKRIIVFASGGPTSGGSGFANLVIKSRHLDLPFTVVAVFTHHENGGVARHAHDLNVPCYLLSTPVDNQTYASVFTDHKADLVALSGWLKPFGGVPTEKVINIHPGPLPRYGGNGMYGHHVHEAVMKDYNEDLLSQSAVCMHFVPPYEKSSNGDNYDSGPIFAYVPVPIFMGDQADKIGERVNKEEHRVQPALTALVAEGRITLRDGAVWMENPAWMLGKELPCWPY